LYLHFLTRALYEIKTQHRLSSERVLNYCYDVAICAICLETKTLIFHLNPALFYCRVSRWFKRVRGIFLLSALKETNLAVLDDRVEKFSATLFLQLEN